ncbi:MAG: hypothetical protein OEY89_11400 [Gammaproteobacteria bacterium]|nr:hypothetical protein [Gammaproteobacteria bacterium]
MSDVMIPVGNGQMAQWQKLVNDAEELNGVRLDEELESYLVFTLMRFTQRPEMAARIMALDYLDAMLQAGSISHEQMRDVGDQCLLLAGLFPDRAQKRRVKVSYYVDLGRSAYRHLAESLVNMTTLYRHLATQFIPAMDTLQAIRVLGDQQALDPMMAFDLWNDTGSTQAGARLALVTAGSPVRVGRTEGFNTKH